MSDPRETKAPYVSPVKVEEVAPPVLGFPLSPVHATPLVRPLQKPMDVTRTSVRVMLPPASRM